MSDIDVKKCKCGCCGGIGEWKRISDDVLECGYDSWWHVIDETQKDHGVPRTETVTLHSSDGTEEERKYEVVAITRLATVEECTKAAIAQKGKGSMPDGRFDLSEEEEIMQQVWNHCAEFSEVRSKIYSLVSKENDKRYNPEAMSEAAAREAAAGPAKNPFEPKEKKGFFSKLTGGKGKS